MGIAIDDPAPCEVCGKPAVTVLVNGRERRLCRDHLPAEDQGLYNKWKRRPRHARAKAEL